MNPWSILASIIFSLVGLVYLKQGKADGDAVKLVCALALLVFPYFVGGVIWVVLIGAALTALPFVARRF